MNENKNYKLSSSDYWILLTLLEKNKRFSELCKKFPKGTVAKELTVLENYGYITRIVDNKKPLQVSYEITDIGKKFLEFKTIEVVKQLEKELSEKLRLMKVIAPVPINELITTISTNLKT